MRLPAIPLAISLTAALISGIAGGIVSYMIIRKLSSHRFELFKVRGKDI
jgi:hypothetical protein